MYGCIVEPYFSSKNVNNGFSIKIFQPGLFSNKFYYKQYKKKQGWNLFQASGRHTKESHEVSWSTVLITLIKVNKQKFCAWMRFVRLWIGKGHQVTFFNLFNICSHSPTWWCWWHPAFTLNDAVFDDSSTPKIWYFLSVFFSHHTDSLCLFLQRMSY